MSVHKQTGQEYHNLQGSLLHKNFKLLASGEVSLKHISKSQDPSSNPRDSGVGPGPTPKNCLLTSTHTRAHVCNSIHTTVRE